MSRAANWPTCGLCTAQDATHQVEDGAGGMLLACSRCAPHIRRATALGIGMDKIRHAEACGTLRAVASVITSGPAPAPARTAPAVQPDTPDLLTALANNAAALDAQGASYPDIAETPSANGTARTAPAETSTRPRSSNGNGNGTGAWFSVRRSERSPDDLKQCNLCAGVFPVSSFPASGDRIKPYCNTCTPFVRRGIQAGMKVQTLREAFQQGGLKGMQDVVEGTSRSH